MIRFKFTYQDRALNKHVEIWNAQSWEDAIILAFSLKKAEWKLLMVECIPEGVDYIRPDDKFEFSNKSFIAELESSNNYVKPPERTQKYFERVLGIKKEKS